MRRSGTTSLIVRRTRLHSHSFIPPKLYPINISNGLPFSRLYIRLCCPHSGGTLTRRFKLHKKSSKIGLLALVPCEFVQRGAYNFFLFIPHALSLSFSLSYLPTKISSSSSRAPTGCIASSEGTCSPPPFFRLPCPVFFLHLASLSCYCLYIRSVWSFGQHDAIDSSPFCPSFLGSPSCTHLHAYNFEDAFRYSVYHAIPSQLILIPSLPYVRGQRNSVFFCVHTDCLPHITYQVMLTSKTTTPLFPSSLR